MKMKRFLNKFLAGAMTCGLLLGSVNVPVMAAPVEGVGATQTVSAQMPYKVLSADEMVAGTE